MRLIGKWRWRILRTEKDDVCINLLRNKYLSRHQFIKASPDARSQFWKGVLKIRNILKWGC